MKILWFGGVFSQKALKKYDAINQASQKWSIGLLKGLKNSGEVDLHVASFRNDQLWPKGALYPGNLEDFSELFPSFIIKYLNIPLIREKHLQFQYRMNIEKITNLYQPDIIMCYNLYPWHVVAINSFKKFNKSVKIVPVILDEKNPENDKWKHFSQKARNADGLVFLSYWGYTHCPLEVPKLHLDAGDEMWRCTGISEEKSKKTILYAGKFEERYGGLKLMAHIFSEIKIDCNIVLCGKANPFLIDKYFSHDRRIKYLGFLDERQLDQVHKEADVFLNPRPPEVEDNRMIFPSKILNYLAYGKPVVSSWTDGIAPEYKEFLLVPDDNSPRSYAKKIESVMEWDDERRQSYTEKIRKWFIANKTWHLQSEKLLNWLKSSKIYE